LSSNNVGGCGALYEAKKATFISCAIDVVEKGLKLMGNPLADIHLRSPDPKTTYEVADDLKKRCLRIANPAPEHNILLPIFPKDVKDDAVFDIVEKE